MDMHEYSPEDIMDDPDDQISLPLGFFRTAWAFQTSRIEGFCPMIDWVRDTNTHDPLEDYDPGYALTTQEPYKAVHRMRDISEEFEPSGEWDTRDDLMYPQLWPSYPIVALIGHQGGVNARLYDMFNRGREYYRSLPAYLAEASRVDVADEIMDISLLLPVRSNVF